MPPYIRRRLFRGWDWFTPRSIRHLPWREQERLTREAWGVVVRRPRYRLVGYLLPALSCLATGLSVFGMQLRMSPLMGALILINLLSMIGFVTEFVWLRRAFREALRNKLLDAGIRTACCFECGYDLEGYEGKECPVCDAPLLREDQRGTA